MLIYLEHWPEASQCFDVTLVQQLATLLGALNSLVWSIVIAVAAVTGFRWAPLIYLASVI